MKRTMMALSAAAVAALMIPATAQAVPYGPGITSVSVSDTTPPAGGNITVNFNSYAGGEEIEIDLSTESGARAGQGFRVPRAVVGTVTADADGDASAVVVAPSAPGVYVLTGTGLSSGVQATATIEVVAGTGGGGGGNGGGGLPATGSDNDNLLQAGAVVLLLGVGLVGVAAVRRRRTTLA